MEADRSATNAKTTTTYDPGPSAADRRAAAQAAANGPVTTYVYDSNGRLLKLERPDALGVVKGSSTKPARGRKKRSIRKPKTVNANTDGAS